MIRRALFLSAFVAAAALAAETPISTPPPGPSATPVRAVNVAPLGDGFLGVWTEGFLCGPTLELRGMRFDRQLRTLDERSFPIAPPQPSIGIIGTATDGNAAYVAWQTPITISSNNLIGHLARIDGGAAVTVLSDSVPLTGTPVAFRVTRDYFVFLSSDRAHNGALSVTLLDRGGRLVRDSVPVVDPAADVTNGDAVVTDNTLVMAWIGGGTVYAASVFLADIAANRVPLPPVQPPTGGHAVSLRLVSDGTHTIVFWSEFGVGELRARALNALGKPVDAAPVTVGSFLAQVPWLGLPEKDGFRFIFEEWNNGRYEMVSLRTGFDGTLRSVARNGQVMGFAVAVAQNGGTTVLVRTERRFAAADINIGVEAVASALGEDGKFGPGTLLSLNAPVQHVRKLLPFGAGAAAIWTDGAPNARLVAGRLSASGKPLDGAGVRLFDSPYDQNGGAVATDGERLAVVWHEGPSSRPQSLYVAVIAFGESPAATVRQLAADVAYTDTDIGISWTGSAYVIAWPRLLSGQKLDLAALRIDRSGNPIDPVPVSLQPASLRDVSPRLVSNGSDFLLLWERWYDPFTYISLAPPCLQYPPIPNELYAQRFSAALTPVGAVIPLVTTPNYDDYLISAQDDEISFGAGVWMISWLEMRNRNVTFARVDSAGRLLDPLNGRSLFATCDGHFLAPASGGWMIASRDSCGGGAQFARLAADGTSTEPVRFPLAGTLEAFTLAPQPVFAYHRPDSSAAFVDVLPPPRSRAARK